MAFASYASPAGLSPTPRLAACLPACLQSFMVRFTKMGKLDGETNLQLPPITERTVEVRAGGGLPCSLPAAAASAAADRACHACLLPFLPPKLAVPLCMFPQLQAPLLLASSYAVCWSFCFGGRSVR